MKLHLFVLAIAFLGINMPAIYAQYDPEARKILDGVSEKYEGFSSIEADFVMEISNPDAGISDKQSGKLYLSGKKYRIETKEIDRISDGNAIWTIFKNDEEVQVTAYDDEDNELTPAQLFSIYQEGYKYVINNRYTKDGFSFVEIDLTPEDRSVAYFKIRITINEKTKVITSANFFSKNGTQVTYELQKFTPNTQSSASIFSFNANNYRGFDVIDLR
ncbi:MAG: outer membrane lipoprotein carrier protein LolA [Chitinophagales bacterium]|nr:outer membrane lipoprotein carrier protein LolA [Bacteroidota bacterium]MCB9043888.1 outer membrane lipoprotein carrier protein LolA [Chitinophagales bacterium]